MKACGNDYYDNSMYMQTKPFEMTPKSSSLFKLDMGTTIPTKSKGHYLGLEEHNIETASKLNEEEEEVLNVAREMGFNINSLNNSNSQKQF